MSTDRKNMIEEGRAVLGIEFGSTRIKAVLVDEENVPIAAGSHEWENRLENGLWTYSLEDIWSGLQDCYQDLRRDVKEKYGAELVRLIGSPRLRVLYDVYHMQLNEGCLCETIARYGDTFGHVHVADAPGRHEPGTGEICYRRVYDALEEAGYDGLLGYELFPAADTAAAVRAIMGE